MKLSWEKIGTWASSDILEAGSELQRSGGVGGVQAKGNVLGGTVSFGSGSSRRVVRLTFHGAEERPQVDCACSVAQRGEICKHAIALAKQWVVNQGEDKTTVHFAAETAPTVAQVERWCGTELFARVKDLVMQGCVTKVAFHAPEGKGVVLTKGLRWDAGFTMTRGGLVTGHCRCERARESLCEHAMAVALSVARQYASPERRERYEADRRQVERLAQATGLIERGRGGYLAVIKVFVGSEASLPKWFEAGKIPVRLMIYVQGKGYLPNHLPQGRYTFSEGDDNLLTILEDVSGGALGEGLTLTAADFMALMRCSARSWVGSPVTRKRWMYEAEPLQTLLRIEPNIAEDCLVLSVERPAEGWIYCYGRQGFWLHDGTIRPLATVLPGPYQGLYHEAQRVPRSQLGLFLQTELPRLLAVMPHVEEAITPDLFTTTPGKPQFIVTLSGSAASVSAKLQARYGSTLVYACGTTPVFDPDPDDFYHCFGRNDAEEKAALDTLRGLGFYGEEGEHMGALTNSRAVLNMLGSGVPYLRRLGWRISLRGAIEEVFEAAEVIVPLVKIEGGKDAFEVSTSFESARGTITITAPEVERAMACGNAYIEKEGQVALLDIRAIQQMRETFNSCQAKAGRKPGSSRVDNVHAPFVQAALSELEGIDFEESPDWRLRASKQNRLAKPEPVPLGVLETVLRPYQKEGVYWLRFLEEGGFCGILADEMGLGKTLQTLTWLQLVRCREAARRVPALIVCPTSLVENWAREAKKFVPQMHVVVISGPNREALFAQIPKADLVITSYALIRRDSDVYEACRFSVVALDEAQAIKNQRTQNAVAVKKLNTDTKLVLSGTPIENGVSDLWSIMDFLMPNYLGPYESFKVNYEERIELGGSDAEEARRRLREKLHPFLLRRVKKEVAKDLPEKIKSVSYCTLTVEQRAVYDHLRLQMLEKMRGMVKAQGFEKSKFEMLALLMQLRQICCDLRLLKKDSLQRVREPSAKLDMLMELLAEAKAGGHRMLVFSQFTSMLKLIAERFEQEQVRYCYLDGSTKDRMEQCVRFNQTPEITVFLISLKAGGTGLNLTGADMVVHFDPWWNPAAEDQATDRAHRIGQKKTVQAIKLIAQDTIEEKVLALQEKKQALISAMVEASDASIAQTLTWSEIEGLLA